MCNDLAHGLRDGRQMPASSMNCISALAAFSFSGDKRLGLEKTGGPLVTM